MKPMKGTTFGWSRRLHTAASLQNSFKNHQGQRSDRMEQTSYLFCRVLATTCVHPKLLDTNFRSEGTNERIAESSMSTGRFVMNRKSPRNVVSSRENFFSPTDLL